MELKQSIATPIEAPKRRRFLAWIAGGVGAVAGAGILGWKFFSPGAQSQTAAAPLPPPLPTREEFAGQIHSKFAISSGDSKPADIELESVSESKIQNAGKRQFKTFSLIFKGPIAAPRAQNVYTLRHEKLGTMDLFLVPFGKPKGDVVRYEAVFTVFC